MVIDIESDCLNFTSDLILEEWENQTTTSKIRQRFQTKIDATKQIIDELSTKYKAMCRDKHDVATAIGTIHNKQVEAITNLNVRVFAQLVDQSLKMLPSKGDPGNKLIYPGIASSIKNICVDYWSVLHAVENETKLLMQEQLIKNNMVDGTIEYQFTRLPRSEPYNPKRDELVDGKAITLNTIKHEVNDMLDCKRYANAHLILLHSAVHLHLNAATLEKGVRETFLILIDALKDACLKKVEHKIDEYITSLQNEPQHNLHANVILHQISSNIMDEVSALIIEYCAVLLKIKNGT